MNTELLNVTRMTAGMLYPGRAFQQADLNQLYASVTQKFPFQNLQQLPNGIRMANNDNDLILQGNQPPQPGLLQVNFGSMLHFEVAKEQSLQVFEIVADELGIQAFFGFGIKLTGFLPAPDEKTAKQILEDSVFSGFKNGLNQLGDSRLGTGFRVLFNKGINTTFDLKIEPFFQDVKLLFIEVDAQFQSEFNGIDPIEERMDNAYRFLNEDVRSVLSEMT
ncbi:MAG: hypothetical protein WCL39_14350 [Armatimonadota bacterium]